MVTATKENRKELPLKVNIEPPFGSAGPPQRLSPDESRVEKAQASTAALQEFSQ